MKKKYSLSCYLFLIFSSSSIGQSVAGYNIIFESFWNAKDHGTLPNSPHWSSLVGANHNNNVIFLEMGEIASQGIENIAETGNFTIYRDNEVNLSITNGNCEQFINGGGLGSAIGTIHINGLEISENYPLLSLVSMIAPSPDWMIAVNGINLRNKENTDWLNLIEIDLFIYDAGTDAGTTYNYGVSDITPHIPINSLKGVSPFNDNPVGKLTISLQNVLNTKNVDLFENIKIFHDPTMGKIYISNYKNIELNYLEIYNILGGLVKKVRLQNNLPQTQVDVTHLNKGIYIINLKNTKGAYKIKKLIIN